MADKVVVPRRPPNPIVTGKRSIHMKHAPIIYTKGTGSQRVPVFARVIPSMPKAPSVETKIPLPPSSTTDQQQQPMTPTKRQNISPNTNNDGDDTYNNDTFNRTPPESPIDPKVVGLMIEQRRKDYAERLRERHKRIYVKPQHNILKIDSTNTSRKKNNNNNRKRTQKVKVVRDKWEGRPEEKAAILTNNAIKRSEDAMRKLKEDRLMEQRKKESATARRLRVNEMGRLIRQQNKIRMQEEMMRAATTADDDDRFDYENENFDNISNMGQSIIDKPNAVHILRNDKTGEQEILKTVISDNILGTNMEENQFNNMVKRSTIHRPPQTKSRKLVIKNAVPPRPRKPRVPRLSGNRSVGNNAKKNKRNRGYESQVKNKRKPPVPRLSGKSKSNTRNNNGGNNHNNNNNRNSNKTKTSKNGFKIASSSKVNSATNAVNKDNDDDVNITKENEKNRIQEFIKEKRKRRRQEKKNETLKEAKEDLLRRKRLRQLDEKFKKRRETIKKRIAEEAREKSKRKKARRKMMKRLRKEKKRSKKTTIDDLPNRANLISGDIYSNAEYVNDNLVDQFEWQAVETNGDEYYNDTDDMGYDRQLSPSPVSMMNDITPSNSRPTSSLAQPYSQNNMNMDQGGEYGNGEDDADFLNREALLNGVGIVSDSNAVKQQQASSSLQKQSDSGDLNINSDYRKLVEQSAGGQHVTDEQQQVNNSSSDPQEREIILNRMNALKRATEQLSARISVLSSQKGTSEDTGDMDATIVKQMAIPADLQAEEAIERDNMRRAKDTLKSNQRVETESARHIHRLVKEVANAELPEYLDDEDANKSKDNVKKNVKRNNKKVQVVEEFNIQKDDLKKNNNKYEEEEDDEDYEDEFDSDNYDDDEDDGEKPGVTSLSTSVRLNNDTSVNVQDDISNRAKSVVKATVSSPTIKEEQTLQQQDSQFNNVLKDAHDLFQKHSKLVDESYPEQKLKISSTYDADDINTIPTTTNPTVNLKLAAEAAAAVAAATRASREALDRARELEADSKIGILSVKINGTRRENNFGGSNNDVVQNPVIIENDFKMSPRAYDIVDSYSILDIYAQDAVQHEHYQKAMVIRDEKLKKQEEEKATEMEEEQKQATVAIQTGTYWDTMLMKDSSHNVTEERGVGGKGVVEIDPKNEQQIRENLPSPHFLNNDTTDTNNDISVEDVPMVPYSPPRSLPMETEKIKRLSPGSLSRKLLAEVDLLQELTESEKQLDAIVHANELQMAQKETIELANQWNAQQEEAAQLAERVAAEQAHAAEMQMQASQITLTLQAAHEEQLLSMNAHLEMIRKENEAAKIRETGAQTTQVVTLNQGTDPEQRSANNQSIALSTGGLIFDARSPNADRTVDDLIENTQEYSADFEIGDDSTLQSSKKSIRKKRSSNDDSEIPDEIDESLSAQQETQNQTQMESIAEEDFVNHEASMQSIVEDYVEDFESVKSEEILIDDSIKEENSAIGRLDGSNRSIVEETDLERSTKRLIKKIQKDMETRHRHENELLDVREAAIKERTKERMNLLEEGQQVHLQQLSVEEIANERDRITYTFKKNIAEVQRQRASLQVRHYREILKLRSRQKILDKLSSTENDEYSSDMESDIVTTDDDGGRRSKSPQSIAEDKDLIIEEPQAVIGKDKNFSRAESFVLEVREVDHVEDEVVEVADEFELNVQEESVQEDLKFTDNESSRALKRSLSRTSEASVDYVDDFEDDFEDDGLVDDSIRMQAISQELKSLQRRVSSGETQESSTDSEEAQSLKKREAELKKRREKAEKLLREKQKIVERARRREVLEAEEKKVNDLLERALNYDVEEEIKKLKSADEQNKTQMHRTSKLSPVQQQLLQNQKMQRELKEEQNNDKSVISNIPSEDEDVVDEVITVHETSTSRMEDSYGDDTFEDSNRSITKKIMSSPTPVKKKQNEEISESPTNNKKANTKTTFTIEDDEEESISIESDIVIEDDDVEDNVDIGESWKNSMTSFDQNDDYDSNASSSFMGSAVKAPLSARTDSGDSKSRSFSQSPKNSPKSTVVTELELDDEVNESSNLESFDMVDEARTPRKLSPRKNVNNKSISSTKKKPSPLKVQSLEQSQQEQQSMLDSFDMVDDAKSPKRISSAKKSPKKGKDKSKTPSPKSESKKSGSRKKKSPRSSGKKDKKKSNKKSNSPKNKDDKDDKFGVTTTKQSPKKSVVEKLGKDKAAEVLTDMILKDLAIDASKSIKEATAIKNEKAKSAPTLQDQQLQEIKDTNKNASADDVEGYTDDGGSDFVEESLDMEDDVVGGLGNTLDGGGGVVLNSTNEDLQEGESSLNDTDNNLIVDGNNEAEEIDEEKEDMYEFDEEDYLIDDSNNNAEDNIEDGTSESDTLLQMQKLDEELRKSSQAWNAKSKIYIDNLLKYVGLHPSSTGSEARMKMLILELKVDEKDQFFEMFEDGIIRSDVYMDIEREAENDDDEGIYNKLIFDAINECIETFRQKYDTSGDKPWIRKHGPPNISLNHQKMTISFLKIIDEIIHKYDDFDADPKRARRFADLDVDTAIALSTAPLTSDERLEVVLTAAAIEVDKSWNEDYEKVEAQVKIQVADMILEELLYDTTYNVHLVKGD